MSEASISQEELNALLMQAKNSRPATQAATGFDRQELLRKFSSDMGQLEQMLKEYNISLTQEEVDRLLKK
jgi:hypothetical protein